jgi:starvation-inducible DNA-binding protein
MKTVNKDTSSVRKMHPSFNKQTNTKKTPPVGRANDSSGLVQGLNQLLSDEYALFTKTLNYHWNVTGPRFHSIHSFLETHYRTLLENIDDVAERIREVGGQPYGTMTEFVQTSQIKEKPGFYPEASHMISDLLHDHNQIQSATTNMIENGKSLPLDPGSEDFLTGLLKQHEEMAWMLKSHLS